MTQPSDLPPSEIPIRPRHIRAPQGDGETLIDPPLASAYPRRLQKYGTPKSDLGWIFGKSIEYYKLEAANQLFSKALRYTKEYRDVAPNFSAGGWGVLNTLAGHQPELFHPGVWLKNFVLGRVHPAINLVVDNDIASDASIRIPSGTLEQPSLTGFALDEPYENVAFEERPIVSATAVKGFASRLRAAFNPSEWFAVGNQAALLADQVTQYLEIPNQGKPKFPLGETLARARHRLEQDLGLETLELPLSHVVKTEAFRQFALHLFFNLPRFQEIYNRSLTEYRIVNKIRSHSHPVPALDRDGEWIEAPFWIWTKEKPLRRRLFVRNTFVASGDTFLRLSDRTSTNLELHCSLYDQETLSEQLGSFESRGIKIRPRALITTMYARLFLSDLFIHGIGGAKYDELTDAIIRRFFGIEPPAYMTVTGTVRLPIPRPDVSAADVLHTKHLIREIRFHPEKFVNDLSPALRATAAHFAAKKAELLRQHQFHFRGASPEQFRALDDLNRQLQLLLTDVEIRLRDELKDRERHLHAAKILGSREYSFVLHPADTLPDQLKKMAASS